MSKMKYREILTAGVGSGLEYYDFLIFGFFAPIFAPLFFPVDNHFLAVLWGYSAFAIGFVFRPIGGIIFGHIGDRIGRKAALSSSIIFMGFGTLLIGVLPTYEQIGMLAPILLILARIVQGISIGGEFTGGMVFAVEHSTKINKKGLAGGLVLFGAMSGTLSASIASYVVTASSWMSWRYPFILGFFISIVGLYIRRKAAETEAFEEIKNNNKTVKYPVVEGIKKYPKHIFHIVFLSWFCVSAFITHWVFLPSYLKRISNMDASIIDISVILSIFVSMVTVLIVGYVSDLKIARSKIIKIAAPSLAGFVFIMYSNLSSLTVTTFLLCQFVYAVLNGMFAAPLRCYIVEVISDIKVRYSSYSFANGLGEILGGLTPLIAATLTSIHGGSTLLGAFILSVGALAFFSIHRISSLADNEITNKDTNFNELIHET